MKTVKIFYVALTTLAIIVEGIVIREHSGTINNLEYQDEVNKINIKYLEGLTADKAEEKQEEREELRSIRHIEYIP